jgi:hypothetical protein
MEEQKVAPVVLVQKLIAAHTTRKEAIEKISQRAQPDLQNKLKHALLESDKCTEKLLSELSEYGDAVQSEVDRTDEYQTFWSKETSNIDKMDDAALLQTFQKSEQCLINLYQQIIDTNADLPTSLNDLIISQLNELKQATI